jgi:hypothetical protein
MQQTEYKWAVGFHAKGIQAQSFGELFDKLAAEGGGVQPERIISAASQPSSPIHSYFEWDNTAAGHQWRLNQARALCGGLRRVVVKVEQSDSPEKTIRAVVNLDDGRGYHPINHVLSDDKKRIRLLELARKDVNAATNKLSEFEDEAANVLQTLKLAQSQIKEMITAPAQAAV